MSQCRPLVVYRNLNDYTDITAVRSLGENAIIRCAKKGNACYAVIDMPSYLSGKFPVTTATYANIGLLRNLCGDV